MSAGQLFRSPVLDLCRCGHPKERHWAISFGVPGGACMATVDKRHVSTGGDTLTPCDCRGYFPMMKRPTA